MKEMIFEIATTSIGMVVGIFTVFLLIWLIDQFIRFVNYLRYLDEES